MKQIVLNFKLHLDWVQHDEKQFSHSIDKIGRLAHKETVNHTELQLLVQPNTSNWIFLTSHLNKLM